MCVGKNTRARITEPTIIHHNTADCVSFCGDPELPGVAPQRFALCVCIKGKKEWWWWWEGGGWMVGLLGSTGGNALTSREPSVGSGWRAWGG